MKVQLFALVVLFAVSVKSIPLSQVKQTAPILATQDDYDKYAPAALYGEPIKGDAESDDEAVGYRLPNNSIPIHYDLWLKTDVDKNIFNFTGHVKIHVKIIEKSQSITLHIRQLTIDNIEILSVDGEVIQDKATFGFADEFEFLIIALPEGIEADDELVLDISYHGILREDGSGFYRASYRDDETNEIVWFATTQFEMTDARHGMPCYDEPGIRATTKLSIQHGMRYEAISNMPVDSKQSIEGTDYVTTTFKTTIKMQSYLLAFIISDFKYVSNNNTKTEQRVYAKPSLIDKGQGDFAVGVVDAVLRKLEEHYGIEYPLPKMDHAAITDYIWGAMENFGLITYQDRNLLFDKENDPIFKQKSIIELISHEYTHQYFGNIVSPKWWSYTWLNEAFATLYSNYIPYLIYPEEDYLERFLIYAQQTAFNADTVWNDAVPLNHYVETPNDIRNKFGTISYRKGGSFLRMFQEAMTVPTFTKGLHYYLTEMYLQAATPQDLHRNLQKAYNEDFPGNDWNLDALMSTWEVQAGYPLITVSKTATSYTFTQTRFGGGDEIYSIPVSFATKAAGSFNTMTPKFWLTGPSFVWESNESFIVLNVQSTGYYKVSYDKSVLAPITEYIRYNSAEVPALHRAQLFAEVRTNVVRDTLDAVYALNMLFSLHLDDHYSVWVEGNPASDYFFDKLFGTDIIEDFNDFIKSVVQFELARVGFTAIDGESSNDISLRKVLTEMACKAYHEDCFAYETQRVVAYVQKPEGLINVCNGLRRTSATVHAFFIDQFLANDTTHSEELGCPLNEVLIKNLLQITLDETNSLTLNQRVSLIESTASKSVVAFETVVRFILENYAEIQTELPNKLSDILMTLAKQVRSSTLQDTITDLLVELRVSNVVTNEVVTRVLQETSESIRWYTLNSNDVKAWLDDSEITTIVPTTTSATTIVETSPVTQAPGSSTVTPSSTTAGAGSMMTSLAVLLACASFRILL